MPFSQGRNNTCAAPNAGQRPHLKNFSLLQDGVVRTRRLAPAYDLLSTRLVIPEKDAPEEMALTINGKKNKLKFEDFAKNIRLNAKQFRTACDQLAASRPVLFALVQKSFLPEDLKKDYAKLLVERATRLGLLSDSGDM